MSAVAVRSTAEGGTGSCARAVSRSQLGLCVPRVTGTALPSRRHASPWLLQGNTMCFSSAFV